jgi:hypothetical protein
MQHYDKQIKPTVILTVIYLAVVLIFMWTNNISEIAMFRITVTYAVLSLISILLAPITDEKKANKSGVKKSSGSKSRSKSKKR